MKSVQAASLKITAILMLALLASSCGNTTKKPEAASAPEAKPAPADNPITPEKVALGKQLSDTGVLVINH